MLCKGFRLGHGFRLLVK
uniref:Uncharacterized protein n=1 Tax=Rhizophora mucronata TaxID=61149 RepID=A0A2P2QYB7_RHIMU